MTRILLAVLAAATLGACSQGAPTGPATSLAGASSASGLFGPALPKDHELAIDERDGDFDRFMQVARREAVKWQANAVLSGAQAVNVDAQGRPHGGTSYTYTFTAGRNALNVAIAGSSVSFEKAKAAPPMDTAGIVPCTKAIDAALATQAVSGETFVVQLGQAPGAPTPAYMVAEMKKAGARVLINARTGEPATQATPAAK